MLKQSATTLVSPSSSENTPTGDGAATAPIKRDSLSPSLNSGKPIQKLCRNTVIHGYCKYENAGCVFRHDTSPIKPAQSTLRTEAPRKLNVDSPAFMPGGASPVSAAYSVKSQVYSPQPNDMGLFIPRSASSTPGIDMSMKGYGAPSTQLDMYSGARINGQYTPGYGQLDQMSSQMPMDSMQQQIQTNAYDYNSYGHPGQDMYYQQQQAAHFQPLQYHLYAPLPPHKINLLPYQRTVQNFFLGDDLREDLQKKVEATLQVLPNSALPESLDVYYSLVPLDTNAERSSRIFAYPSWVYKAFSKTDGHTYALRRIEGYKLADEKTIAAVQQWRRLSNSGFVNLFEAFTTRAFGDNSIIFVYDYHPLSSTLYDAHFGPNARNSAVRSGGPGQMPAPVSEQVLWSYIVQLSSALKTIHNANLAARVLDPTKVILTSQMRVRLSAIGILDVLSPASSIEKAQEEDLFNLGRLILAIITSNQALCGPNVPMSMLASSLEIAGRFYSTALKNALAYLISSARNYSTDIDGGSKKRIDEFIQMTSSLYQQNLNSALHYQDNLESELAKELENGRLVRLLCKLNFINERPEYAHDTQWSETGERYLLKLFRDFVFHQTDENGNPVVDLAHVLRCMNKLDAGVDEKIVLVSRDEQSCLIVTYKELKTTIDAVFRDLSKSSG
ncbi:uncharacterized protein V1518DRAFT_419963 [Limtongia smithiae]|uniref:uncharacterized protein n=1 Tax=Limtongia smithiae TaxID=1125753 RepID=UPI0034CE8FFF